MAHGPPPTVVVVVWSFLKHVTGWKSVSCGHAIMCDRRIFCAHYCMGTPNSSALICEMKMVMRHDDVVKPNHFLKVRLFWVSTKLAVYYCYWSSLTLNMIAFYCCLLWNNVLRGICISECQWINESKFLCLLQSLPKFAEGCGTKTATNSWSLLLAFFMFLSSCFTNSLTLLQEFLFWFQGIENTEVLSICAGIHNQSIYSATKAEWRVLWRIYIKCYYWWKNPVFMENCFFHCRRCAHHR